MNATTVLRAERNAASLLDASDWVLALQETASEHEDILAHNGNPTNSSVSLSTCS